MWVQDGPDAVWSEPCVGSWVINARLRAVLFNLIAVAAVALCCCAAATARQRTKQRCGSNAAEDDRPEELCDAEGEPKDAGKLSPSSDRRGGAALSVKRVTGAPIKFVGVGEKITALEEFHPERMASRILGMGDVISLVEKAEKAIDQDRAKELEERLRKESFTFDDFREQLQAVKSMGPLDQLMGMIPGAGKALKGVQTDDGALGRVEAIMRSLTAQERVRPQILNGSRRRRIARGSGSSVQDVNRLLKQFHSMQKMMRQMNQQTKGRKRLPSMFAPGMS